MKQIILFLFISIALTGCNNNVKKIIKHRDEIIALTQNKEIFNEKERNFYMLTTYSPSSKMQNEYFFNREEREGKILYTLLRDSIQFTPDAIINISKESDNYQKEICNYYQKTSQYLESYGMKSLSGERYKNDPKVTIYIIEGGILIYEPNKKILGNKDYAGFRKVENGWYLLK